MYPIQLALLGAEALMMATLVLGLFRSRTVLALSPLYIVLGGFQYLEASLSLRIEIAPGWQVYPASTVMFTATLLAVLLVYIKEEITEARKLVYGLVLANIGLTLVALVVSEHVRFPGSAVPAGVSATSLQANALVAAVRATGTDAPWSLEVCSAAGWADPANHVARVAAGMRDALVGGAATGAMS